MVKFGHSGDIHIGALKRWAPLDNEYLKRQVHNLNDLVKKAAEEKLDFFLISGDFFDSPTISMFDFLAGAEFLKSLCAVCPVILTPGNHDEISEGLFVVQYLSQFNIPNLYIYTKKTLVNFKVKDMPFNILACPWTGIKKVDDLKEFLVGDIVYGTQIDIAMLHECFMGSVLDNGRKMSGVEVPDIGAKYYACGDIHKQQKLNLPNAYFSGSPMQVKTDDANEKGFMVVEVHSEFDYRPRFVKLENQIEIKQVSKIEDIGDHKHWYKLVCPINQMPLEIPSCVKVREPLPAVEDQELFIQKENLKEGVEQVVAKQNIDIDYTFGLSDFMVSAQYTEEEIKKTQEEIEKVLSA